MDSLAHDIRYGLRTLARQPGFVVAAVLSLALGLGVNTAVFSAMDALLLRPAPVRDPNRTVYVYHATPDNPDRGTSFQAFRLYRDRTDTFSAVMASSGARPLLMIDGDRRDQVYAELVAGDFFAIANIALHLGRPFDREVDSVANPPSVAVLSHRLWTRRFAADPAIAGKTILLNGREFAVAGVAAAGFTGLDTEVSVDLWIPMTTWAHVIGQPARLTSEEHWITTIAQLKPGVSLEQARAAMWVAGQALRPPAGQETRVRPVSERLTGSTAEVLAIGGGAFAAGLLVLALACLNVTNLLMARAAARQREMAVRLALGSGRGRLIRLWVIESLLICATAGSAGLVLASWLIDLVVAFSPPTLIGEPASPTLSLAFQLDARVFGFAFGLSALTALSVGLIAGVQAARGNALQQASTGRVTDRRFAPGLNLRSTVIALQMALSLMLLIPCGLFVRSWLNASSISPGFATDNVLLLPISTDQAGVRVQKPPGFDQQIVDRVAALPGVEAATAMDPVPLWFAGNYASFANDDEQAPGRLRSGYSRIGPRYFATLRMSLLRGRDFTPSDNASAPPVAIVNESFARRLWPDGNALGRRIRQDKDVIEIVGVARDAKYLSLADSSDPWLYLPLAQNTTDNRTLSLAVRGTSNSRQLQGAIEHEVRALVPSWPMFQFRLLDEGLALQRLLPRLAATLLGVLGLTGLLLAAVGVYGVMAYVVKQRAQEIGIRLALGSPGSRVLSLVIRQGMSVCLTGAVVGLGAALGLTQLLTSVLYGIGAADPLTFTLVPLALILVALAACYLPARHIARMNLLDVLRRD